MKTRIIALLLLLAIALTACASSSELKKSGKEDRDMHRTDNTVSVNDAGVDIGAIDGNTYRNASLGFICEFPEDWYIYDDADIASLNNLLEDAFDRAAVADAIENGQVVMFFFATQPGTASSVNINVNKNQAPGTDEKALIESSIPLVQSEMEQLDGMERVNCALTEAAFCGRSLPAMAVTCETASGPLYETILYLLDGEYIYTLTAASDQENGAADILDFFSASN